MSRCRIEAVEAVSRAAEDQLRRSLLRSVNCRDRVRNRDAPARCLPENVPGLAIDVGSDVPVYRQIADGIRDALADGRVSPGRRLPPTRDLARQRCAVRTETRLAFKSDRKGEALSGRKTTTLLQPIDSLGLNPIESVRIPSQPFSLPAATIALNRVD